MRMDTTVGKSSLSTIRHLVSGPAILVQNSQISDENAPSAESNVEQNHHSSSSFLVATVIRKCRNTLKMGLSPHA